MLFYTGQEDPPEFESISFLNNCMIQLCSFTQDKRIILLLQEPFATSEVMTKSLPYQPIVALQKQSSRNVDGSQAWVNDKRFPEFMIGATNMYYFVEGIFFSSSCHNVLF
jgi:hypothetical protein